MTPITTNLRNLWRWATGRPRLFLYKAVLADPPKTIPEHVVYAVIEEGEPWQAAMLCPCGCKAKIHLSLLPGDRPCWGLARNADGTATLHPSVWRTTGCRSHFFVRNGETIWCDNRHV